MCLDNEFIVFFELGRLLLNSNFMKPWGFSYQLKERKECRALSQSWQEPPPGSLSFINQE